jgi:signal transduction histidine kinase
MKDTTDTTPPPSFDDTTPSTGAERPWEASSELIRRAALGAAGCAAVYAAMFFRLGDIGSACLLSAIASVEVAAPIWLDRDRLDLARAVPVVPPAIALTALTWMHGTESQFQLYFFPLLVLPILTFPLRERRGFVAIELFVASCFIFALLSGVVDRPPGHLLTMVPAFPSHILPLSFASTLFVSAYVVLELSERQVGLRREIQERRIAELEAQRQRRAAEVASRAKQAFVTSVSHEIRTPLNGVLGMTEILSNTSLTRAQRDMTRMIQSSGEMLRVIVHDILQFSELDAGRFEILQAPFLLGNTIENTVETFADRASQKRLTMVMDVDLDGDFEVIGDSGRIRQVLTHLLNNAIKFTEEGRITISVRATTTHDTSAVEISIEDTGPGIPKEEQEQIFAPFIQGQQPSRTRPPGTGLGLALCQRIIQLMDGALVLDSVVGRGTKVTLQLKLVTTGRSQRGDLLANARVALVSANEHRLRAISQAFVRMGARVTAVSAPQRLGEGSWDLLLLDIGERYIDLGPTQIAELVQMPIDNVLVVRDAIGLQDDRSIHYPAPRRWLADELKDRLTSIRQGRESADAGGQIEAWFDGIHALVAEDDLTSQMVLRGFLASVGITCDVVSDGRLATETFHPDRHRIVFMDVHMPRLSGVDATGWIRRHVDPDANVPIVATTAHLMVDDGAEMLTRGFDDYIYKPLRRARLIGVLRRFFARNERQRPRAGQT